MNHLIGIIGCIILFLMWDNAEKIKNYIPWPIAWCLHLIICIISVSYFFK